MIARDRRQAIRTLSIMDRNPEVTLRVPCAPWITITTSPTRINRPAIGRDDLL